MSSTITVPTEDVDTDIDGWSVMSQSPTGITWQNDDGHRVAVEYSGGGKYLYVRSLGESAPWEEVHARANMETLEIEWSTDKNGYTAESQSDAAVEMLTEAADVMEDW